MTTKEKILQLALDHFNREGYNHVGVRELARNLQISPGNLSYHFPRKEDLLFSLLEEFSRINTSHFTNYFDHTPSLERFLLTMKNILHTQFAYRGIIIGNHFMQQELQTTDRVQYAQTLKKRKNDLRRIFEELIKKGFVSRKYESLEFLQSWMTLFGRFALQEAFLLQKERNEKEVVDYYMTMLCRLLLFLSTEKGRASVKKFLGRPLSMDE